MNYPQRINFFLKADSCSATQKFPQPYVAVDWLALLLRIREAHFQISFRQQADYDYVLRIKVAFLCQGQQHSHMPIL
jgi:hypothetical protein